MTATATGAGGAGQPLTTSFTVAPAPPLSAAQRRIAGKVNGALAGHAPVYTCATPGDFSVKPVGTHPVVFDHTVKQGCPPSRTVVAGGLQFDGCLEHLTSEDQIPKVMQGMLPSFGSHLTLGGRFFTNTSAANADLTFGFIDAYIAYDPVKVNGLTLIPAAGAAIVIAPQLNEIVSSDAQMAVGNVHLAEQPLVHHEPRGPRRFHPARLVPPAGAAASPTSPASPSAATSTSRSTTAGAPSG